MTTIRPRGAISSTVRTKSGSRCVSYQTLTPLPLVNWRIAGVHVLGLVVEDGVGAPGAAQVRLLRRADRGDDLGADRLGHLHHHRPDAAGAAVDEDDLAGLQFRARNRPRWAVMPTSAAAAACTSVTPAGVG